ncbi:hypothetical protein NPIL_237851 [Nephila pilipes]|uniref:Uncharacterized protein n=1 Tax=Nephila pilipes TaxID=299642 RepID=A0A8X6IXT9_NEPPI|nr:hypothetical protein NPIL_237851 [Nephila pilipes]
MRNVKNMWFSFGESRRGPDKCAPQRSELKNEILQTREKLDWWIINFRFPPQQVQRVTGLRVFNNSRQANRRTFTERTGGGGILDHRFGINNFSFQKFRSVYIVRALPLLQFRSFHCQMNPIIFMRYQRYMIEFFTFSLRCIQSDVFV